MKGTCEHLLQISKGQILDSTSPLFSRPMPHRIADAEKAVALRAKELFQTTGDHIEEEYAMEDAKYALHALWSTSRYAISRTFSYPKNLMTSFRRKHGPEKVGRLNSSGTLFLRLRTRR